MVCCDMSPAFIEGVEQQLPHAQLTYVWLKNPQNLKAAQSRQLEKLDVLGLHAKTARAYHIRLNFQELWQQPPEQAEAFLSKWYCWATQSRLEPIIEAVHTFNRHGQGILRWFPSRINSGILEGINSLGQAAKARARGYRSTRNFITMIYLPAGTFKLALPS